MIFDSQMEDGTWRKGEPIFVSGAATTATTTTNNSNSNSGGSSGSSSNSGSRDIGNSYVFFFDIIEVM